MAYTLAMAIAEAIGLGHFAAQSLNHERTGEIGSRELLREHAFSASPVA